MNQASDNSSSGTHAETGFRQIIPGNSEAMQEVFDLMEKGINLPGMNISLHGEPGTGKKLVARTLHEYSRRSHHPFVSLNANAIPENEIEECFFGAEKGAFNGALITRKGKFEEAGMGTLFIDEVSDLKSEIQIALLNALQEGKTQRAGGQEKHPIRCRIITSTNGDLLERVKSHNFREDLYYHLVGLPITLPPLRQRENDILLLANHFLKKFCDINHLQTKHLSVQAREKLMEHPYPGNIRELKAVIELGAALTPNDAVEADHIVFDHFGFRPMVIDRELTLKEYNEQIILHFLKKYKSVKEVASRLDIGKSTIYNLLKQNNHFKGNYS
ncbi:MAG: sigma-54-dependent transcriptional regulator [Marinilabiliaceae bacterium]